MEDAMADPCPRCGGQLRQFPKDSGASSRIAVKGDIKVCAACGMDESIRDTLGLAPIPRYEWPIKGPLLTPQDLGAKPL